MARHVNICIYICLNVCLFFIRCEAFHNRNGCAWVSLCYFLFKKNLPGIHYSPWFKWIFPKYVFIIIRLYPNIKICMKLVCVCVSVLFFIFYRTHWYKEKLEIMWWYYLKVLKKVFAKRKIFNKINWIMLYVDDGSLFQTQHCSTSTSTMIFQLYKLEKHHPVISKVYFTIIK